MTKDFDFLIGSWKIHNRYLKGRLKGSTKWIEFTADSEVRPLLNGLGNIDRFTAIRDGRPLEGVNLRLLNPATGEWSLYWADTIRAGILLPPIIGKFQSVCGEFYGLEEVDGREVPCRSRWDFSKSESPVWEQAFSPDHGKTWETNWVMTYARAATRSDQDDFLRSFEQTFQAIAAPELRVGTEEPSPRRVAFKSGTRRIILQLQRLEWLEAQRDYVLLHVGKEKHLIRATMSRMEAQLDPRFFRRIHRSAIVNIDYMKEVKTGGGGEAIVVLQDGTTLPLGRGYREPLLAALDVNPVCHSI